MTIDDLDAVKKCIEDAKSTQTKAEGAKERILKQLETDFAIKNVTDIQIELDRLQAEIEVKTARQNKLLSKLDALTDWDI